MKKHKKFIGVMLTLLLIVFFIWNPINSSFINAIKYQEIFLYHINDMAINTFAKADSDFNDDMIYDDWYQNEKRGKHFGIAKDKNLFVIQLESFQNFPINYSYYGQEVTPFLNELISDSGTVYFDNFYQQNGSGNTSDAEFAMNNSIVGTCSNYTYQLYDENTFRGLPVLLKEQGYSTTVFHAYENRDFWNREEMYPSQGFDNFVGGIEAYGGDYSMTQYMGWGLPDKDFFTQSVDYMKENVEEPFYNFLITLSNHHPFKVKDEYINITSQDNGKLISDYLNSAAYTDDALSEFIGQLKDAGLYDNSVIVIYGDHHGIPINDNEKNDYESVMGEEYRYDTMMNVPLIIHMPGENVNETISTAGGPIDILPSLAYLFGFEQLDTLYLGHNLFTIHEGFVGEHTYVPNGSFFTNKIAYEMSKDGIFEHGKAWRIKDGAKVELNETLESNQQRCINLMEASDKILKEDLMSE